MTDRSATNPPIRLTLTRVGLGFLVVMPIACALPGCATPYKPMTWAGGFDDFRITEDTFEVTFRGNSRTARETVSRYVFRRAAEVTIAHGFTHFAPIFEVDRTRVGTVYQSAGYGGVYGHGPYLYDTSGGFSTTIEQPAVMMRIQCFNEPLPDSDGLVDAAKFLEYNYPAPTPDDRQHDGH